MQQVILGQDIKSQPQATYSKFQADIECSFTYQDSQPQDDKSVRFEIWISSVTEYDGSQRPLNAKVDGKLVKYRNVVQRKQLSLLRKPRRPKLILLSKQFCC